MTTSVGRIFRLLESPPWKASLFERVNPTVDLIEFNRAIKLVDEKYVFFSPLKGRVIDSYSSPVESVGGNPEYNADDRENGDETRTSEYLIIQTESIVVPLAVLSTIELECLASGVKILKIYFKMQKVNLSIIHFFF